MYLSPIFNAIEILSSFVTCIFEIMQFSFEQMPIIVILFEEILVKVVKLTCLSN